MIEVEFTKTTLLIKGSIAKFNLDLAYNSVEKVAKRRK
jgi:hypothetical protein